VLQQRKSSFPRWLVWVLLIALVLFAAWGIISRVHHTHKLKKQTKKESVLVVNIIHPEQMTNGSEIVLPGNVRAWHEASLTARVQGYLKTWNKDIGDRVKAGDVLAEIDTPETDRQLQQAEADLAKSIADSALADVTAKRWTDVVGSDAVSHQETDEKVADARDKAAIVLSQKAARDRLRELETFKKIIAPFDGVVTARTTDLGALISAGSGELYHIASTDQLRVYVNVPEMYVSSIAPEITAELHFGEYPDQVFQAKLLNTSRSVDPTNKTILAQFSLDNSEGIIYPGGYVDVHLKSTTAQPTLRLPVTAFLFQDNGLQAAIVGPDNKIKLQKVTPGRDFGKSLEVVAGLTAQDNVISTPQDSIYDGEPVRIAPAAPQEGGKQEQEAKQGKAEQGDKKGADKSKDGSKDKEDSSVKDENAKSPDADKSKSGGDQQKDDNQKSGDQQKNGKDKQTKEQQKKSDDPNTKDDAQ